MHCISFLLALICVLTSLEAAPATAFGFALVPKKLIVQNDYSEIVMSLVLLPEASYPGVELEAASKGGRTHITFSKPLKKFIKSLNLTKEHFRPFVAYLKAQVKSAKANPDPFIIMLDTYLKTGADAAFAIDLSGK